MSSARSSRSSFRLGDRAWRVAPFLLLALFALPALWPLLRGKAFCTHDGSLHFYRLVALRHAIDQGLLFSRWTPGLVYGYGFPFFNFREMGSYYVPEVLHLLGLSIPAAINVVYAGGLLLSGWGAFLLARDIWRDEWAGLVAAIAYMVAPYQLLDVTVRGNLPESMALALLPFIVWLFRRLVAAPGRLTFILATLSVAALLLIHNISSLLFLPALVVYLATLFFLRRRRPSPDRRRAWLLVAVVLLLGIGLTAFSWLPAIAEKDSVQLYLTHSTRGNDFRYNFLTLGELLAPPTPDDPTLLNPPVQVNLGLLQVGLGMVGLLGLVWFGRPGSDQEDHERRWHSGLLALATALMLLFALPLSAPLWESLPLIRFVQFPWRLVGRAALPLAILAGTLPALVGGRPIVARVLAGAAITALLLAALPWLYPPTCSFPDSPTIANVMDFERASGLTGVDPLGAYLPRWVVQRPTGSPMEAALRAGTTPRRFDAAGMPAGARVLGESYGPNRATIELETPIPFRATYHTFYFPGWTVRVDGERVPVVPTDQTGLISFEVPAGRHTVTVRWELTPSRTGAAAVSVMSLVALALVSVWFVGEGKARSSARSTGRLPILYLIVLALVILGVKALLVDPGRTPLRQERLVEGIIPGLGHPLAVSFADGLELMGYELTPAPAGSEFRVDLAWTARQGPEGDYASRLALVDAAGLSWSAKETYRPRGYQRHPRTVEWRPGAWAWDSHSVPILPGTPPGTYQVRLTVFDRATLAPLNVLDEAGRVAGPDVVIGELVVARPEIPTVDFEMQYTVNQQWGDLTLLGVNLDRAEAAPGEQALITLFWQADAPLPELAARLGLEDPAGETVREWHLPLIRDDYPSTAWRPGDGLMGQHLLQIPGRVQDGRHTWQLVVVDASGTPLGPPLQLGTLLISAPERLWEPPAVSSPADIVYTAEPGIPFARLTGYDLERAGDRLGLTLVWQAEEESETNYRVYVHLLAPDGRIVAQSDAVPAGWTRPTPGWAPGEYVVDSHTLTLPDGLAAGEYALAVGFYDLATGDRPTATQDIVTELTLP
jgi:hypothetical protein